MVGGRPMWEGDQWRSDSRGRSSRSPETEPRSREMIARAGFTSGVQQLRACRAVCALVGECWVSRERLRRGVVLRQMVPRKRRWRAQVVRRGSPESTCWPVEDAAAATPGGCGRRLRVPRDPPHTRARGGGHPPPPSGL